MNINEKYPNKNILFLVKSEIRLKILNELNKKPQTINDIVKKTNMSYSSVSGNLNKLEYNNHVQKVDKIYELTPMTKLYLNQILEFKKSMDVIKNFNSLWEKHNINNLSDECIQNITYLYESKLIETNPIDIYKTHNSQKKQMMNSHDVKAIFPYLHPDYPKLIEKILENNGSIELIMNRKIYRKLMYKIDDKLRKISVKNGNLKVNTLNNNIDIYLLICDKTMNLGLFKNDGSYDQNRLLTSNSEESINWAESLFQKIKENVI